MKTNAKTITALFLSTVMMFCSVGCVAMAGDRNQAAESQNETVAAADTDQPAALTDAVTDAATGNTDASKEETVYVIAGADGSVKKIIVSDWIRNESGETIGTGRAGVI